MYRDVATSLGRENPATCLTSMEYCLKVIQDYQMKFKPVRGVLIHRHVNFKSVASLIGALASIYLWNNCLQHTSAELLLELVDSIRHLPRGMRCAQVQAKVNAPWRQLSQCYCPGKRKGMKLQKSPFMLSHLVVLGLLGRVMNCSQRKNDAANWPSRESGCLLQPVDQLCESVCRNVYTDNEEQKWGTETVF